jgi:hypothetical protein
MTNNDIPPIKPKPKRRAHTELRRQPVPQAEGPTPLMPRTPSEGPPKSDEDGLDDLFNDMPV